MNKPKPSDRLKQAVKNFRAAGHDRDLKEHLQSLIAYEQELLVTALPDGIRTHQGRVMAFREILSLLTE